MKTELKKQQAEARRKAIEDQLAGSQYGIAYTDGAERITQLNRPSDEQLMDRSNGSLLSCIISLGD